MWWKIIWTILILALIGGAFWWFQIRSVSVRKFCYSEAQNTAENMRDNLKENGGWRGASGVNPDPIYEECLRKFGLY